jgi:hypothetical protein
MNAPPFPANPAFGQYFGNWVWSGSRWVCTNTNGVRIVVQVFRASAPYTPSPGLISAVVETVGAGGDGGAAAGVAPFTNGGGGGGSGGYSRITLASGLVLGGVNVTIGQGAQVAGGTEFDYGPSGGPTSFGSMCVANGGTGGGGNAAALAIWGFSGPGALPGIGDLALPGNPGGVGTSLVENTFALNCIGGFGGSIWGGGGISNLVGSGATGPGFPGTGPGAGGSGACTNNNPTTEEQPGGAGAAGICIVTEYCWADAIDDGCGCGTTMSGARVAIPAGPQGYGWDGND